MSLQSFAATASPAQSVPRLKALRAAMAEAGFDAFIIPRSDAHGGEYVAPRDERLAWLTGFTGSAGFAIATGSEVGLFVDGRYTVQARAQSDAAIAVVPWPATKPADWLAERLPAGSTVGFDPWLHAEREVAALRRALTPREILVTPVANPVDAIWPDQPPPPAAPARAHPEALAGCSAAEKREAVAAALREAGQRAAILTLPESICWLLNIRGGDVPRVPVMHAFAILHDGGRVELFADAAKLAGLDLGEGVAALPPAAFQAALTDLSAPVRADPATAPFAVFEALRAAGTAVAEAPDPCLLPKARKTAAELAGAREAQGRDGAAMCRFLHWLDDQAPGSITEIDVARRLEMFRSETELLQDLSFDSIVAAGPHGAITHYRVTTESNLPVTPGLLLIDSGGQYRDGTTDVTRTIAIGAPAAEHRRLFTQVLRGMIAVSRARFPRGVAGCHLDALARQHLWAEGRDFDHGTGHGVGSYLSVHEGPQRLSRTSDVALEEGMILSNEPGYYREGAFGIRIENLLAVVPAEAEPGRDFLGFETLTTVPIDRRLIDPSLMAPEERAWLDAYHAEVAARIKPRLGGPAADWLAAATAPL